MKNGNWFVQIKQKRNLCRHSLEPNLISQLNDTSSWTAVLSLLGSIYIQYSNNGVFCLESDFKEIIGISFESEIIIITVFKEDTHTTVV